MPHSAVKTHAFLSPAESTVFGATKRTLLPEFGCKVTYQVAL
jgi:hypothetical protein